MGIDYDSVLITGYILDNEEYDDEDKVEELATKLKCEFAVFNYGYDDPFHYALIPKGIEKDKGIDLSTPDALNLVVIAIHKIKERADALGIKLPKPVITSQLCVW